MQEDGRNRPFDSAQGRLFYRWKKKFAGMGVAELRRLRQLEEENRKLKQLVTDLSLDKEMLQDVIRKNSEACSIESALRLSAGRL